MKIMIFVRGKTSWIFTMPLIKNKPCSILIFFSKSYWWFNVFVIPLRSFLSPWPSTIVLHSNLWVLNYNWTYFDPLAESCRRRSSPWRAPATWAATSPGGSPPPPSSWTTTTATAPRAATRTRCSTRRSSSSRYVKRCVISYSALIGSLFWTLEHDVTLVTLPRLKPPSSGRDCP